MNVRDLVSDLEPEDFADAWRCRPDTLAERWSHGAWKAAPHHRVLAQAIYDCITTKGGRLLVEMPPRYGKSALVSQWTPAWILQMWPTWKVLLASYGSAFASEWGAAARDIIIEHGYPYNAEVSLDTRAKSGWTTTRGGGMWTAGLDSVFTGRGSNCMTAGTMISTENGQRPIEGIKAGPHAPRVLSWNHAEGRYEYRHVIATHTSRADDLIEVVTTSGRRFVCTPEHRVFELQHGYRQARDLVIGSRLHTQRSVPTVRNADRDGRRGRLPSVLHDYASSARDAHLRELSSQLRAAAVCRDKARTPRLPRHVLLVAVQSDSHRNQDASKVSAVRRAEASSGEQVLRRRVSAGSSSVAQTARREELSAMWRPVPASDLANGVLHACVCERGTCRPDARQGQLALPHRDQLCGLVPQDAPADPRTRSTPLRDVRSDGSLDRASHQRNRDRQPRCEPDHALPTMPHDASQVEVDTVAVVRKVRSARKPVYDIQVEGNSNYVASGVLVHNCMIIDDPHKNWDEASSVVMRDHAWNWYLSVARTRLAPGGSIICCQTRWNEDDLGGRLERASVDGSGEKWTVLRLPAIATENETHVIGHRVADDGTLVPVTWSRQIGDALWPEQFSLEEVVQTRQTLGPVIFSALYQQSPSPGEGSIIKRGWWKRYEATPSEHERDDALITVDSTFKETSDSDFVVIQVWWKFGARKYLITEYRDRMDYPTLKKSLRDVAFRHPECRKILVEDSANGPAVVADLAATVSGLVLRRALGSKESRVHAVTGDIESGNVFLPDPGLWPGVVDFIEECAVFPNGSHDDRVDAMTQVLLEWRNAEIPAQGTYSAMTVLKGRGR